MVCGHGSLRAAGEVLKLEHKGAVGGAGAAHLDALDVKDVLAAARELGVRGGDRV